MSRWKICQGQKGASAVEFAVILPLLVLILFGIIEFSLLLYNKQVITNAGREGARAGIVARSPRVQPGSDSDVWPSQKTIKGKVNQYCSTYLISFASSSVVTEFPDGFDSDAEFGDDLKIKVTYEYTFLVIPGIIVKLFNGNMQSSIPITATTVMQYE
jgi:Flp pilus assembly protein TadG